MLFSLAVCVHHNDALRAGPGYSPGKVFYSALAWVRCGPAIGLRDGCSASPHSCERELLRVVTHVTRTPDYSRSSRAAKPPARKSALPCLPAATGPPLQAVGAGMEAKDVAGCSWTRHTSASCVFLSQLFGPRRSSASAIAHKAGLRFGTNAFND